jgi:BlaI family transcriptional regulator, penicillinase repressor
MGQQLFALPTGIHQSIGENGHPLEGVLPVDALGQVDDGRRQPAWIECNGMERVAGNVAGSVDLPGLFQRIGSASGSCFAVQQRNWLARRHLKISSRKSLTPIVYLGRFTPLMRPDNRPGTTEQRIVAPMTVPRLGKMQLMIMQILWERGRVTARDITDALNRTQPVAHSTVQTLLRKLEAKGAVAHEVEDRTFRFYALAKESKVTRNATRDLVNRLFGGSVGGLISHLLKHERIPPDELEQLRRLINETETK